MFERYALQDWPAEKVAKTSNVSTRTVYDTTHRILGLLERALSELEESGLQSVTVQGPQNRLSLSTDSIIISKHGIEFRSTTAFSPWTEMTMTLQSPQDGGRVHCNGVVISCGGNRHTGYHVSMVFTNLSKQAEERLSLLAFSQLS